MTHPTPSPDPCPNKQGPQELGKGLNRTVATRFVPRIPGNPAWGDAPWTAASVLPKLTADPVSLWQDSDQAAAAARRRPNTTVPAVNNNSVMMIMPHSDIVGMPSSSRTEKLISTGSGGHLKTPQ